MDRQTTNPSAVSPTSPFNHTHTREQAATGVNNKTSTHCVISSDHLLLNLVSRDQTQGRHTASHHGNTTRTSQQTPAGAFELLNYCRDAELQLAGFY